MLTLLIVVLVLAWIVGFFLLHVSSMLIHLLLLVAAALFVWRAVRGENPLR